MLGGCGRQQTKIIQQTQDSIYLAQYIHPVTIVCMNDSLRQIVRDSIHAFRFDTMHYHTIADIDNELAFLLRFGTTILNAGAGMMIIGWKN